MDEQRRSQGLLGRLLSKMAVVGEKSQVLAGIPRSKISKISGDFDHVVFVFKMATNTVIQMVYIVPFLSMTELLESLNYEDYICGKFFPMVLFVPEIYKFRIYFLDFSMQRLLEDSQSVLIGDTQSNCYSKAVQKCNCSSSVLFLGNLEEILRAVNKFDFIYAQHILKILSNCICIIFFLLIFMIN